MKLVAQFPIWHLCRTPTGFQAAEACTSAHFLFYLVIGQKRLEFMFTLRKSVSGYFQNLVRTLVISRHFFSLEGPVLPIAVMFFFKA